MLDGNYIVEKSKPLVWAMFNDYNAGELKILDTYLARIDARRPESSRVSFTKKEYATLMGIDQDVRSSQLKSYTEGLLRNVVTIDMPDDGYRQFSLFSEAECRYDPKLNQVVITIDCNPKLKSIFFNIAQSGYVKYQLKNVIALKSQYSIRLYVLLKDRPYGWTVDVDNLRKLIGAESGYQEFKDFNKHVIKKAITEINSKTDLHVEVELIRSGRNVSKVRFNTVSIKPAIPKEFAFSISSDEPQAVTSALDFTDFPEQGRGEEADDIYGNEFLSGSAVRVPDMNDPVAVAICTCPPHFSRAEASVIYDAAKVFLPDEITDVEEQSMWISDYISSKVFLMGAQKKPVQKKSQFIWLKRAIEEDWH